MTPPAVRIATLSAEHRDAALAIINGAAGWYDEIVDGADGNGREMGPQQWDAESQRMTWFGAFADGALIGVIGLEHVADVALLRHWYVAPQHQRSGAGSLLREHLEAAATGVERIVAGTYAANYKARGALERAGYQLSSDSQAVLTEYYDIPPERRETSVTYELMLTPDRSVG